MSFHLFAGTTVPETHLPVPYHGSAGGIFELPLGRIQHSFGSCA
ncbi:uncharacterized protein METZ01_LOCUS137521 [marine metagenome]|uniref:Uncharacterized protein n=1 Tax=marine metagenome TaxID=408172 RepID=A0A381Z7D9_9ZZZZ